MKLALALALAICAVRKDATAAAVERDGRHPLSRRLASEVGGGGSKGATPPPVPSSKKKHTKSDSAVLIGVFGGGALLFILCFCLMFCDWKKIPGRAREVDRMSESSPLLPEPE